MSPAMNSSKIKTIGLVVILAVWAFLFVRRIYTERQYDKSVQPPHKLEAPSNVQVH